VPSGRTDVLRRAKKTDDAIGGWIVWQCRVLQARRAGSILTYVTREASAARREIGHEAPPPVVFYEMFVQKTKNKRRIFQLRRLTYQLYRQLTFC